MRDSIVFFRSYHEALKVLPADQYKEAMEAILNYAFDEVEPDNPSPTANLVFQLVKPTLDTSHKKAEAGRKGGQAKVKQSESKVEANAKQNEASMNQSESKGEAIRIRIKDKELGYKEKNTKKENTLDQTDPPANGITIPAKPWDKFWSMYGKYKKAGENYAMLAFNNAAITTDPEIIIAGLQKVIDLQWSKWPKEKLRFIPKAENWLKGGCWKDDVQPFEPNQETKSAVVIPLPKYPDNGPSKKASPEMIAAFKQKQKEYAERGKSR